MDRLRSIPYPWKLFSALIFGTVVLSWGIALLMPDTISRKDYLDAIPSEQYTRFVQQDRFENFLFNYFRQQQTDECLLLTFHVRTGSLATIVVGDAACEG